MGEADRATEQRVAMRGLGLGTIAELAGKGTYYRAMVGPFGTRDQAVQLCSSLKAAGGDCVVQAN